MNYLLILKLIQILLVFLWSIKIYYHFMFLKSKNDKYSDVNFFYFLFKFSYVFDRFYVNSPFFILNKSNLTNNSLKLGEKTQNITRLLLCTFLFLFGYMIYLQAVLKIRF